ncbi:MAG: hydrogenase [Anaerolineae bacterium]|nr:hydrogenase [Gemmatimonadaceae bacterium]
MSVPARVAILGAGEIGSGWAALFAAYGAEVRIFDRDTGAEQRSRAALTDAVRLGVGVDHMGSIDAYFDLDDAIEEAEWIQEALPEERDIKREILGSLERTLSSGAIVASSSSSFTPTELAKGLSFAERLLVAHPLHPVYAVPVVELCGGIDTNPRTVERAAEVMRAVGRQPIVLRSEVTGLVTNRLTAALLREAFDLVTRGVVSLEDLDSLVSRGIALGWVAAGPLATEAIGAGNGGFPVFLNRYERPLANIWKSLASWTSLSAEQRAALEDASRNAWPAIDPLRADAAPTDIAQVAIGWSGKITEILRAAGATYEP